MEAELKPKIILSNIGVITDTDVTLASASNAIIIGFNVRPKKEAKMLEEQIRDSLPTEVESKEEENEEF